MKNIILIPAAVLLFSMCSNAKLSYAPAKAVSENCLKAIDKDQYDEVIQNYYSSDLGTAENAPELKEKFKKLKDITGDITSVELTDSAMKADGSEEAVVLTYNVNHSRITTTEKFTVTEQGGSYKIITHDIKNK